MSLLEPGQRYAISGNIRLAIDSVEGRGSAQFWVVTSDHEVSKLPFADFSHHGIRQEMRELSTSYEINPLLLNPSLEYCFITDDRSETEDLAITNLDDARFHIPGRWIRQQPVIALRIHYLGEWKMTITADPFESPASP